jgi:hypothetical protein
MMYCHGSASSTATTGSMPLAPAIRRIAGRYFSRAGSSMMRALPPLIWKPACWNISSITPRVKTRLRSFSMPPAP